MTIEDLEAGRHLTPDELADVVEAAEIEAIEAAVLLDRLIGRRDGLVATNARPSEISATEAEIRNVRARQRRFEAAVTRGREEHARLARFRPSARPGGR
jgi:hypothetical protein